MAITDTTSMEPSLKKKAGSAKLKLQQQILDFSTTPTPSFQETRNQVF